MNKKNLTFGTFAFSLFAIIPLIFSIYNGNAKDSIIISCILIGVLAFTFIDYKGSKNKKVK